jgi:hypothetical protein
MLGRFHFRHQVNCLIDHVVKGQSKKGCLSEEVCTEFGLSAPEECRRISRRLFCGFCRNHGLHDYLWKREASRIQIHQCRYVFPGLKPSALRWANPLHSPGEFCAHPRTLDSLFCRYHECRKCSHSEAQLRFANTFYTGILCLQKTSIPQDLIRYILAPMLRAQPVHRKRAHFLTESENKTSFVNHGTIEYSIFDHPRNE